jgi:hypothetical protein
VAELVIAASPQAVQNCYFPRMPKRLWIASAVLALSTATACDSSDGGEPEVDERFKVEKKFVPLSEREVKVDQSPEELAELRKKSGFKTQEEIAAENAKMFEKGAREHVKTKLEGYREVVATLTSNLDEIDKESKKWLKAKDPAKAHEKWAKKKEKANKELEKLYMDISGNMSEGGDTTAKLGKAYRGYTELFGNLGGKVAENERFPPAVEDIRKDLETVVGLLDDIEKDDTLVVNKFADRDGDDKK